MIALRSCLALLVFGLAACPVAAQQPRVEIGAQAIPGLTHVDPVPLGGDLTEARVVQPMVMVHARGLSDHLRFVGTLNLEGGTIPDGELTPGAWGEGFTDRRHPHTYAHELMLSVVDPVPELAHAFTLALSVGKGFAPFGSDDPMSRPTLRYPVNHHLAQVLERAVAMVGVRKGPVLLEAGLFNGDEPERPGQWPRLARFGDSWSTRLTVVPARGVELSGSRAKVHSPEHRPGAGTDAYKWHVAARLDRELGPGRAYLLGEWARTEEADGFFVFHSLLAEGRYRVGGVSPYVRFERTDRPEDVRTSDPFRSLRPHLENGIVGTTRFTIGTAGLGWEFEPVTGFTAEPFAEGSLGRMRNVDGGIFDPEVFYGRETFSAWSLGLRLRWRLAGHRMGRYGGLLEDAGHPHHRM